MLAALREAAEEEAQPEARVAESPPVVVEAETWKKSDERDRLPVTRPADAAVDQDAKAERVNPIDRPRDTIPAPAPELYKFEPRQVPEEVKPERRLSKRTKSVLAGSALVVLILASGYAFWLVTKNRNQNTVTQADPTIAKSEQPGLLPPPSPTASPTPSLHRLRLCRGRLSQHLISLALLKPNSGWIAEGLPSEKLTSIKTECPT